MTLYRTRNFPFYLFVAVLAAAFCFFFWQAREEKRRSVKKSLPAEVVNSGKDQQIQKFTLAGFDNSGQKFWNLQGESAKIDPGQTVYLDQNVTLKLKDNTVIRTDHVQWSQEGGQMRTNSQVFVDHETVKVKGIGAVGRPSDSFIQLNRQIEMTSQNGSKLTCEGPLKIYYNENKMIFYRHVKVVDERGELTANRMDVLFDPEQKKLQQIIAIGDVVIQRGTDMTRSRKAIYTPSTGSIRLEGNPEITLRKGGSALLEHGFKS